MLPSSLSESIIAETIPNRIKNRMINESKKPAIEANMNLKNCFMGYNYMVDLQM
jgi:hypothetical protein